MSRRWFANVLLLITAAVWGFAFVAQRVGMDYVGPFTFNAIRFALGAVVLSLITRWFSRDTDTLFPKTPSHREHRRGGLALGVVLFIASSLQQMGLVSTTAGKAGFITGLYVVLVPLLGLLRGERHGWYIWSGAILAVAGLYLLSVTDGWRLARGDALVLLSALFWAFHVRLVGRLAFQGNSLNLARRQFVIVALLSALTALGVEAISWRGIWGAAPAILYGGLISVGIGYTLQVVAQQYAQPAQAAIIMSLEAVFALWGGVVLLQEPLTLRAGVGSVLMLAGMVLSQWDPEPERKSVVVVERWEQGEIGPP